MEGLIMELTCGIIVENDCVTCDQIEVIDYVNDSKDEITEKENWNNMIDGITSLILAHHCAGVDVSTDAYIEGIEVAFEACAQYA